MTDREFKSIIDELWLAFASSGISNPISVIEQMTYLIFFKNRNDFFDAFKTFRIVQFVIF